MLLRNSAITLFKEEQKSLILYTANGLNSLYFFFFLFFFYISKLCKTKTTKMEISQQAVMMEAANVR